MTEFLQEVNKIMSRKPPRTIAEIKSQRAFKRRQTLHVIFRVLMGLLILLSILAGILLQACSTDDDRDICCEGTSIRIRYIRAAGEEDSYRKHIKKSHQYLFDATGTLLSINDVTGTPEELLLKVNLDPGCYTLLVLGNHTKKTNFNPVIGQTRLNEILMKQHTLGQKNFYNNGDLLYWGLLTFEVLKNKRSSYVCDVSNIHCHLLVTVKWKSSPPKMSKGYSCRLYGVPARYTVSNKTHITIYRSSEEEDPLLSTKRQVVHTFPGTTSSPLVDHYLNVDMHYAELAMEFITWRYTNDIIPRFRIYHADTPLMKEIDLMRFFKAQGWKPDEIAEQWFHIIIEIDPLTGNITVSPAPSLNVADWVDGGTIKVKN